MDLNILQLYFKNHMILCIKSSKVIFLQQGVPTHLQTELQSGLQVGSQVFRRCVCNFHQGLEHRVITLVAGLIHCLIKSNRNQG